MEIIADDRERKVIEHLKKKCKTKVERITVGDYALTLNGKIVMIIERKTLNDLSSSIKDGRMENNNKLLMARKVTGCKLLYIIEGKQYPSMNTKFSGIQYKCLQGKMDSLLFKHNIPIIWTKNAEHTAERLAGLCKSNSLIKYIELENEPKIDEDEPGINDIIKKKHVTTIDTVHVNMMRTITGFKTAVSVLHKYNIREILLLKKDGYKITEQDIYNIAYDSGFKLGKNGSKLFKICKDIDKFITVQCKILSCITGITLKTSNLIINKFTFKEIISLNFPINSISNIVKKNRRVGSAVEKRIRLVFTF